MYCTVNGTKIVVPFIFAFFVDTWYFFGKHQPRAVWEKKKGIPPPPLHIYLITLKTITKPMVLQIIILNILYPRLSSSPHKLFD